MLLLTLAIVLEHELQSYWCRKQFFGLNCQFLGDGDKFFSVDAGWYGSCSDARVWAWSMDKPHAEKEDCAETQGTHIPTHTNHPTEARFNQRLSAMRTMMTECMYGRLKSETK